MGTDYYVTNEHVIRGASAIHIILADGRTFETLRNTASLRKQVPETSTLSKAEEEERIRVWTGIETDAELLRSSFETAQVTWPAAEKARAAFAEAQRTLEAYRPLFTELAVSLGKVSGQTPDDEDDSSDPMMAMMATP